MPDHLPACTCGHSPEEHRTGECVGITRDHLAGIDHPCECVAYEADEEDV